MSLEGWPYARAMFSAVHRLLLLPVECAVSSPAPRLPAAHSHTSCHGANGLNI